MANAAPITKANVYAALMQKCGFEVLEELENAKQLRISGRSHRDRWGFFAPVILQLLEAEEKPGATWTCDISKKYIKHNGKILYTWRLIFQGNDLAKQYPSIISTIMASAQPARVELTRQLLPGYKEGDVRGGVNARGKGSQTAGSPVMAQTRQRG